jgi:hypothetical protein
MLKQTPGQASQGRKRQTNRLPTRLVRTPCVWFDLTGRGRGLFGPTTGSTWRNRRVSTARLVEPRARCALNRVEGHTAESLAMICHNQASRQIVSYV